LADAAWEAVGSEKEAAIPAYTKEIMQQIIKYPKNTDQIFAGSSGLLMQILGRHRSKAAILVLGIFLAALAPAAAISSDNALVDTKTDASNALGGLSVLKIGNAYTEGAGQIMTIFDICEAVEQAHNGEYDKAMATLLKIGLTTFFDSTVGPFVTSIDAGKLLRDSVVKQVFEPRIKIHFDKYRELRLADLEAELDNKKVTYKTSDFVRWAEDPRGESVPDRGQDTVKRWIDEEFMSDGQKSAYLYNTAQMRIQDAEHDKQPFAVKWWSRFWTSEKPVPFEKTKEYWLETWNAQVVVEGLDIAVKRRREFARDWCAMSSIIIVVDVEKPIEGLKYEIECLELNWREKKAVVPGPQGNYVLFAKTIDMKKFSELRAKYADLGGITLRLKSNNKNIASKFISFADMMSSQNVKQVADKKSMWSEFRVPVRFSWRPDLVEKLNLKFNKEATIDGISFQLGNRNISLQRTPASGSLPKGVLPLEKYFTGGKIDFLAVLKASGLPTDEALDCLYGSTRIDVRLAFRMPDPERDPKRDPPDKTTSFSINRTILCPESEVNLDCDFTPRQRPKIDDAEARAARAREAARAFVAAPGTQPRDYFNYIYQLPFNASPDNYQELADRRINQELVEPLKAFESEVGALNARLARLRADFATPLRKEAAAVDRGALRMRIPMPAYREIIKQDADALKSKIEQGKKQLKEQMAETEALATRRLDALKDAARQLINLNPPAHRLPVAINALDSLITAQQDTEQVFAECERILEYKPYAYDMQVARLSGPAAEAAFYLPSIENLQKRAAELHKQSEALIKEDIRQPQYLRQLSDLLQSFNAWADGTDPAPSHGIALNQLYAFVTGNKENPAQPQKHTLSEMVSGIENATKAAITPETELLQESAVVQEQLQSQKRAAMRQADGISPLLALYLQDIPTAGDIRNSITTLGRLDERALTEPAFRQIKALEQKWKANETLPSASGRPAEHAFWALFCADKLDRFLTLTTPDIMARGDGKAKEWIAKYNTLMVAGISAGSYLQDSLDWIRQADALSQDLTRLSKSPWPDRCEVAWIATYEFPRAGDTLATNMVAAWLGAMDALNKKMRSDIQALSSMPSDKREAEAARLLAIANDSFWNALGLQPLASTTLGSSIYYGCYQARHTADVYAPAHEKWGRLQTAWHDALKKWGSPSSNTPTSQAADEPGKPAPGRQDADAKPKQDNQAASQAYQEYMAAHNAMAKLMAAGKGDTPEGQKAYADFIKAKNKYDASLANEPSGKAE